MVSTRPRTFASERGVSAILAGGRIPIRLDPVPGESFDSWLDAYGQRLVAAARGVSEALRY